MSLESIVFGTKHFTTAEEPQKVSSPKSKAPVWVDPDDLAPLEGSNHERFQQSVQNADVSWAAAPAEAKAETVDASDLFSENTGKIPSDKLLIVRVADLFAPKVRGAKVVNVEFNSEEDLAAILDSKGTVHVVSVNGKDNKVQDSISFVKQPQRYCMCYSADGESIFVAGQNRSLHCIDYKTRNTFSTVINFNNKNERVDFRKIYCSKNNRLIVLLSGQRVFFVDATHRVLEKFISTSDEMLCGTFSDDCEYFIAAGKNGKGLIFDCETYTAVSAFQDKEFQTIHSINFSHGRVAMGTEAGVLHLYDFQNLKSKYPEPLFTKLNLSTRVDTVKFNPTGELVAFASSLKRNSLRILHFSSQKVFPNWPTQNTPLGTVSDVSFDATSQYITIANQEGKCTL